MCNPITSMIDVLVLWLKGYDVLYLGGHLLLLPLFAPLISELFIKVVLHVLLFPLRHHLIELLLIEALLIVPQPLKHLLFVVLLLFLFSHRSQFLILESRFFLFLEVLELLWDFHELLIFDGVGTVA